MIISYLRNSRIQQENSLEVQSKLITEFCENQNIKLDKIICDEGVSGSGEKTNHRKGYNSIIRMIENGEIETIIVISISRWGRNLGEIYKSINLMKKNNVKFLSIKENIDTSSIYGRFTINLLSSLYEMELELIGERVKDTLNTKKQSNKIYGKIPYGMDCVDGKNLIPNPKEDKLIRKMIRLRNKNFSYGEITSYLNRNRYKNKSGGKFTRGNVSGILRSRINGYQVPVC